MAGTDILPPAPPPAEIQQALGSEAKMGALRNMEAFAGGKGFALGTSIEAQAGASGSDGKISLYANLRALVAADMNLLNFGDQVVCKNQTTSPGIQGWYAQGNWYTFLQGRIGAGVGKFKLDLMTFSGALAMNAAAPNPSYASGNVHMELQLTNFLKFKGNLKMEIGEPCEMEKRKDHDSSIII